MFPPKLAVFLVTVLSLVRYSYGGSAFPGCIETIDDLEFIESRSDTSRQRIYSLCENRDYRIGILEGDDNVLKDGQTYIRARPNLTVRCGNGSINNNCVIKGGSLHVDATDLLGATEPPTNVVFEGITFESTKGYFFWASWYGDVTFKNCEFRDTTKAIAPVFLDFFDPTNSNELVVNFEECKFTNHRYFGAGAYPAVITSNSRNNILNIDRSFFTLNDYVHNNTVASSSSSLIDTSGPLTITDSCFTDNLVGVAPIAVYTTTVDTDGNFGMNAGGPDNICNFVANFQNQAQLDFMKPACDNSFEADICKAALTEPPSSSPTEEPSVSPSNMPTKAGSQAPSVVPSSSPTEEPTTTFAPTTMPVPTPAPTPAPVPPTTPPTSGCSAIHKSLAAAAMIISSFLLI